MTAQSPISLKRKNAPPAESARHLMTLSAAHWPYGTSYVQGVQWYSENGQDRWVVARAVKVPGTGGREHSVFHRHDADGAYIDTCVAMFAGHPSSFGVQFKGGDLRVLLRWNGPGGGHIYWMVYRPRKRYPDQARIHPVKVLPSVSLPAVDPAHRLLVGRKKSQNTEVYRMYDFADLRKGTAHSKRMFLYDSPGVFQGHTTDGQHVYSLYGWRSQWSWVEKRTLNGSFLGALDVTRCRERKTSFEVEGLGWRKGELLVGMREGGVNRRRTVSVWGIDPGSFE